MNPFFSTSSLENNNAPRKDCLAQKAVISMKKKRSKELKLLGYQQLSINTFYKDGKTIVLKSMVEEPLFTTVRSYNNRCTRFGVYSHQHQYEIANAPHKEFLEAA